jgi:hypothetical protein
MELRAYWRSGKALESHSGGGRFESQADACYPGCGFPCFSSILLSKCWIVNQATIVSFQILSDSNPPISLAVDSVEILKVS